MTDTVRTPLIALTMAAALAWPAAADDFTDSIEAALEAYRDGDIKTAKEEIDFAAQLLAQMKAEGLKSFLPEALEGWERKDDENDSGAMAAFGGGQMAAASYSRDGKRVKVQLMADNQMVTALAGMFSNSAMMAAMGTVKRINRQKVIVTKQDEVQSLVDGRIMIQITGDADIEDKEAYFAEIDVKGLKEF